MCGDNKQPAADQHQDVFPVYYIKSRQNGFSQWEIITYVPSAPMVEIEPISAWTPGK